jgi:fatty acid desaturase
VQAYRLSHVRNHHRYNNDRTGPDGNTQDTSSTFAGGVGGEHRGLFRYAFGGAVSTLLRVASAATVVHRLWRVGHDDELLALVAEHPGKRRSELRQIRLDRIAGAVAIVVFALISPQWLLLAYLPAFYAVLTLVNIQNYYEHFGANPDVRYADSVSYYGRVFNLLTFNDGYHQEHHLRPRAHWSQMPAVRGEFGDAWRTRARVISPVPAIVGFLYRGRPRLDRGGIMRPAWGLRTSGDVAQPQPAERDQL